MTALALKGFKIFYFFQISLAFWTAPSGTRRPPVPNGVKLADKLNGKHSSGILVGNFSRRSVYCEILKRANENSLRRFLVETSSIPFFFNFLI